MKHYKGKRNFVFIILVFVIYIARTIFFLNMAEANNEFSEENAFTIQTSFSQYGDQYMRVQGIIPNNFNSNWYLLKICGFEDGLMVEQRILPIRSIPEFHVLINSSRLYTFIMSAFDENHALLGDAEISDIPGGQYIGELKRISLSALKTKGNHQQKSKRIGGLEVQFEELICNKFPIINIFATVRENEMLVRNLTDENFSVSENGLAPAGNITIYPPQAAGGERIADFAFVFDQSGSMRGDLINLRRAIDLFVNSLIQSNINFNLSFIPYESSPDIRQDMTDSVSQFLDAIDYFLNNYPGGDTENAFKALNTCVNSLNWRPGSQKIIILLTDEEDNGGGPDKIEIGNILVNSQTVVYAVVDQFDSRSDEHFCAAGSVTNITGGKCYDIEDTNLDFSDILDEISKQIAEKYTIVFNSSDMNLNSGVRSVDLTVNYNGNSATTTFDYDPVACNRISIDLTPETENLLKNAVNRKNVPIEISTRAVSANNGDLLELTLFYRNELSTYTSVTMNRNAGEIFTATIPASEVIDPYIHFFIKATDGAMTVMHPSVNAASRPHVVGVLPNIPPQISFTSPGSADLGKDLNIQAVVEDNTTEVDTVTLYYRLIGNNLYKSVSMNLISESKYAAVIPGIDIQPPGIEFYIEAQDDYLAMSSEGIADNPISIFVSSDGVTPGQFIDVGLLRVWGDQIQQKDSHLFSISGNVMIGTITGDTPLIGFDTAIEADMNFTEIRSIGKGNAKALQIKRNPQQPPEDLPLWYGTFKGNGLTAEIKLGNDVISTFRYISRFLLGWCQFCETDPKIILNSDNTMVIKNLAVELNSLNTFAKMPDLILDPTGNSTTGRITLKTEHFNLPELKFRGVSIKDFIFELDFVRSAITLGGTLGFGKCEFPKEPVLNIDSIDVEFDLLLDPFLPDGYRIKANFTEPSITNLNVFSLPQAPPAQFGVAPTAIGGGIENFSGGIGNLRFLGSVEGALCDQLLIEQALKAGLGIWAVSGKLALTIDLSGSIELTGEASLLELVEIEGRTYIAFNHNNVESGIQGKILLISEDLDILKGSIDLKQSISANPIKLTIAGSSKMKLKVPDKAPLIGGMELQGMDTKGLIIVTYENQKILLKKAEFSTSFSVLFADFTVRVDLADLKSCVNDWCLNFKRRFHDSLYATDPVFRENGKAVYITGYNEISQRVVQLDTQKQQRNGSTVTQTVNIPSGTDVSIIRIVSDRNTPLCDITFPDGTVYSYGDAPANESSPLYDTLFFNSNPINNEAYWALNQPVGGQYGITLTNISELGQYEITVLVQNQKPSIILNSPAVEQFVQPGDQITISWSAMDDDDDAKISLFYDTDEKDFDGGLIIDGLSENNDVSYKWIVPEELYGTYYIYAMIDDGNLGPVFDYAPGRIVLPDAPGPSIPKNVQALSGNGSVQVSWDLNEPSEHVELYKIFLRDDGYINEYVVENPPFTLDNLANGKIYGFAVAAIDSNGNISETSAISEVTPIGLSTDGPPDLVFHDEIIFAASSSDQVIISVEVENVSDYPVYGFKVSCWFDTVDDSHQIFEISKNYLEPHGITEVSFTTNLYTLGAIDVPKTLFFRIHDVVLPELNQSNNSLVTKRTIDRSLDSDGDGTPDISDDCPTDPYKIKPENCGCGVPDTDSDHDGVPDCIDYCPNDPNKSYPGQCGCGNPDSDTDGDGTADCIDNCPDDPDKTNPEICGCGTPDTDSDNDGVPDCNDDDDGVSDPTDKCPNDPDKTNPGICGCGVEETDTDGDGTPDCIDQCPNDPDKTVIGKCGCGTPETDSDGDNVPDCYDNCPENPEKTVAGLCGCESPDSDTDGDGAYDCYDGCPDDPEKTAPGFCGCGEADKDTDGDGTLDCEDKCYTDPYKTEKGECGCGISDTDTDGDGIPDCKDLNPDDPDDGGESDGSGDYSDDQVTEENSGDTNNCFISTASGS